MAPALDLTIRDAGPDDAGFLWLMLTHAASMSPPGAAAVELARADPYLATYVEGWGQPGDLGVVAVHAGEPVGAAWIRLIAGVKPGAERGPGIAELATATVAEHRGRGAGTRLLTALVERARRDRAFDAIVLSVRDGNPAIRLYERTGFTVVETVENRVGGVSYAMRLPLR